MAAPHPHSRWRAAGRLLVLILGIGLTTWGVCLVAFAGSTKSTQIGFLTALWGVVLGFWAVKGPAVGRAQPAQTGPDVPVTEVIPPSPELLRGHDVALRYEFEMQLELVLRRELEQGLRQELSGLRRDVAELRADVLDAVDGRLRLERVEITRIIGSNLAALRPDAHRLAAPSLADAELRESGPADTAEPESTPTEPHRPGAVVADAAAEPVAQPPAADPFAGLPRLSTFRLPALPPGIRLPSLTAESVRSPRPAGTPRPTVNDDGYVGRRRQAADEAAATRSGRPGSGNAAGGPTDLADAGPPAADHSA